MSGPIFFEKVTCRNKIRQTNEQPWHGVLGMSAGSDPWCLWTPRLSEISHLIPCRGHSRCMFHAACPSRSCTAHARDFDARASRLSWPSDQDNPHEHPLDYHMIHKLGILNWAYRRNDRPDLIFRYLDVRGTRKERITASPTLYRDHAYETRYTYAHYMYLPTT